MTQSEYERSILVAAAWKLGLNNDPNELLAIMCVIRNWVVPRYQAARSPMNGKIYFTSYSEAVQAFHDIYPARPLPAINEGALIDPVEGLLMKVDGIYDCSLIDVTSSRAFPFGARYFGRAANPSGWFKAEVLQHQDVHPLIGMFGSQSFYA
jgi:hypothetical protein